MRVGVWLCSCQHSRSLWSHTKADIYQMILSGNHFLRVKGKRAVKPKLICHVHQSLYTCSDWALSGPLSQQTHLGQ